MEAYLKQLAMAAFVLAVIVDGHRKGQEACIQASLIHVCLKHLQSSTPRDAQADPFPYFFSGFASVWESYTRIS